MGSLELAILFHETYERLAPSFGYETRTDTRVFDSTSKNAGLMVAVCEQIQRVLTPVTLEQETNPTPEHGWTCFHCGDHFPPTFAGQQAARHHFGDYPTEDPACRINARQFRAMEDLTRRYQSEDTGLHREIQRLQADHATALRREEEKGYARGLRDASPWLRDHINAMCGWAELLAEERQWTRENANSFWTSYDAAREVARG